RRQRLHEHRQRQDGRADGVHERQDQGQRRLDGDEAAEGDRITTPLSGVRVLDLSRLLPGPYATLVLSDLGADVVKIEDPDPGDYLREISPGMYAALNRGKRSMVLDLKTPSGAAELRRLCAASDVLIESFRPGVLERLGF